MRRATRYAYRIPPSWIIIGCLALTFTYAVAEDLTLTTYYPSPRGVFNELIASVLTLNPPGNLHVTGSLAVGPSATFASAGDVAIEGKVGVGMPPSAFQLDVNGIINATDLYKNGVPLALDIPAGAIMFFNLTTCPNGWSPYAAANGRYVVGTGSGASVGGTVGQSLSSLENRAAGQHNHTVNDPGHHHLVTGAFTGSTSGWRPYDTHPFGQPLTAPTGITVGGVSGGAVTGTSAPYLQLLVCQKN